MRNSPVNQLKFNNLLKTRDLASNPTLTLAVTKKLCTPKLDPEIDSQSEGRSKKSLKFFARPPTQDKTHKLKTRRISKIHPMVEGLRKSDGQLKIGGTREHFGS